MELPRVDVVFYLWQCDKDNHGWREGPPLTVLWQSVDLLAGPSPSGKVNFERKKNTAFRRRTRAPHFRHWPVYIHVPGAYRKLKKPLVLLGLFAANLIR
jgi:hypothetical protein